MGVLKISEAEAILKKYNLKKKKPLVLKHKKGLDFYKNRKPLYKYLKIEKRKMVKDGYLGKIVKDNVIHKFYLQR